MKGKFDLQFHASNPCNHQRRTTRPTLSKLSYKHNFKEPYLSL